jgi:ankyrin repeat protein
MLSASSNTLACTKALLEIPGCMVDLDLVDHKGWTAAHYAVDKAHFKVFNYLEQCGANMEAVNDDGWTPAAMLAAHFDRRRRHGPHNQNIVPFRQPLFEECGDGTNDIGDDSYEGLSAEGSIIEDVQE